VATKRRASKEPERKGSKEPAPPVGFKKLVSSETGELLYFFNEETNESDFSGLQ
jgi:hypothetical protein